MTFSPYDVVVVPFPFTDARQSKRRPAAVISRVRQFNTRARHCVLAMITSGSHQRWPLDTDVTNLDAAGLHTPSIVRMKVFTLDHRLILRKIGRLSSTDRCALARSLSQLIAVE